MTTMIPAESIVTKIVYLRGVKGLLDRDLAELYQVETGILNRAVKRNLERFPEDFMFQVTAQEAEVLRCQFGISKPGRGGRRYLPYVFTEQGVAMLSSVLRSKRAIQVNISIMRAFVKIRKMMANQKELARKLQDLEKIVRNHDGQIQAIFEAIRALMNEPEKTKKRIGFEVKEGLREYGLAGKGGRINQA